MSPLGAAIFTAGMLFLIVVLFIIVRGGDDG